MSYSNLFQNPIFIENLIIKHKELLFVSNMEINLDRNKLNEIKNIQSKLFTYLFDLGVKSSFAENRIFYSNNKIEKEYNLRRDIDGFIIHTIDFRNTFSEYIYILNEKLEENIGKSFCIRLSSFQSYKGQYSPSIHTFYEFTVNGILNNIKSNFRLNIEYFDIDDINFLSVVIYPKDMESERASLLHRNILDDMESIKSNWERINYRF